MIFKLKPFEKYLNLLFVFLLPTQLSFHFWPEFSLVFGLRVDYLSPAIFLTDILFVALFVPWFFNQKAKVLKDIRNTGMVLIFSLLVIFLNLIFSTEFWLSLIKSLKLVELVLIAYYVKKRSDIFSIHSVGVALLFSSMFFVVIGILQVVKGATLGGIFYWLGERAFAVTTPGIAITNLLGGNILRIYSTFPHPNSLAGFFGAVLIFLLFNKIQINGFIIFFGYVLIAFSLFLSFSLSAYIGLIAVFLTIYLLKEKLFKNKVGAFFSILVFLLSFNLAIISKYILSTRQNISQSFSERLVLADMSGKIFSENWITGVGLNTFIPNQIVFSMDKSGVWLLQPVHNIYLLVMAEMGLLGLILLLILIQKIYKRSIDSKNVWGLLIVTFVLITGLFDHYWFTIQQNMLLLALLLGIFLREK